MVPIKYERFPLAFSTSVIRVIIIITLLVDALWYLSTIYCVFFFKILIS